MAHPGFESSRPEKSNDRQLTHQDHQARLEHLELCVEPVRTVRDARSRRRPVAGAARIATRKAAHESRDVGGAAKLLGRCEARANHPAVELLARAPGERPARFSLDRSGRLADEQDLRTPLAGEGWGRLRDDSLVGAHRAAAASRHMRVEVFMSRPFHVPRNMPSQCRI